MQFRKLLWRSTHGRVGRTVARFAGRTGSENVLWTENWRMRGVMLKYVMFRRIIVTTNTIRAKTTNQLVKTLFTLVSSEIHKASNPLKHLLYFCFLCSNFKEFCFACFVHLWRSWDWTVRKLAIPVISGGFRKSRTAMVSWFWFVCSQRCDFWHSWFIFETTRVRLRS